MNKVEVVCYMERGDNTYTEVVMPVWEEGSGSGLLSLTVQVREGFTPHELKKAVLSAADYAADKLIARVAA